jgi:hypothetical protein
MRRQVCVAQLRLPHAINDGDSAVAVTDDEVSRCRIDPHVVGVVAEIDHAHRGKILAAIEADGAVAGARDGDRVRFFRVADALRFFQMFDPVDDRSRRNIDGLERSIAQFRDEQPLALEVDRHVIDTPADVFQHDLAFQHERRRGVPRRVRGNGAAHQREQHQHHALPAHR